MSVKIAYIIPVYNEAVILEKAVALLLAEARRIGETFKIIVAVNGSSDGSASIAGRLGSENEAVVPLVITEPGRGNALRKAVGAVDAEAYLYADADLPFVLEESLGSFVRAVLNGADIVVGSRVHGERPLLRKFMTFGNYLTTRLTLGITVSDPQCGIKAFSKKAARVLAKETKEERYVLDTEMLLLAKNKKMVTKEIPLHWIEQRFPERHSKVHAFRDIRRHVFSLLRLAANNALGRYG